MTEAPNSANPRTHLDDLDDELPTGPGASFTFLYYFSTAALLTALFTARTFGVGLATGLPGQFALVGGAMSGLLGVFMNRTVTVEIPFTKKKPFLRQLESAIADMGYSLDETEGTVSRYRKVRLSRWLAGNIFVQQREQSVMLVSRAANVRTLKKRLK
ncbi:hypothetical protein PN498_11635 [Oscillatoria sp. CS-180]|uniref:hypothetical protein n=1 Tax=Oscillatoria sp. CS-180 TaxID=3021720 RepID=UPI00232F628E|nr:hypothetical protein [Oscillatoria sp. CS-180]MDB9526644.1 hypothetical protein [Oscillatoria sp. CS-180]